MSVKERNKTKQTEKEANRVNLLFPGDILPPSCKIDKWGLRNVKFIENLPQEEDDEQNRICKTAAFIVENPCYPYRQTLHTMQKNYVPFEGDFVIGVVSQKRLDCYYLDINSAFEATLNMLSFERATKKNKPNICLGGLVYAVVETSPKEYEAELTCISTEDRKGWDTNEKYFGELKGGYLMHTTVAMCHSLMGDNCYILERVGRDIKFEIAIGNNARVWIKANTCAQTIAIANIINSCYGRSLAEIDVIIQRHLKCIER